ncbi:Agp3p [Sugiyamaella lignohabitans]|uniref:Agp3p n=1 Tax=Sugiyamaella lignohabitans TaxID=796027 RepID=A0A167CYA8_9ASCO|nr:Agp3p [Sugiyamaella lignohabitans]ANB12252.1 Agp3p [Sugiyamaella lignohabitans]
MDSKDHIAAFSTTSTSEDGASVYEVDQARDVSGDILDSGLRRGLKGRQFLMIALGSIVGPGCYYGLGYTISLAGPVGNLVGFAILGIFVWILMQCVGEITCLFPVAGGFIELAATHVDPALSFSMSWLYYIMWSVFLAADWNTATLVLQYWIPTDKVPMWAWLLIFWAFFSVLTTLGVGVYGEMEYFFGMAKFASLIILFFISILANVGAFGNGYVGFKYWEAPTGKYLKSV